MPDPIMSAIASTLAGKAADAAWQGARGAWTRLVQLVHDRFAGDPDAADALSRAQQETGDVAAADALATELERVASKDDAFASRLRELWAQARPELTADNGSVINYNSGHVNGSLVQASSITGNLTLNSGPAASGRGGSTSRSRRR